MRGAIFDLDGTLLDTSSLWTDIDRAFFLSRGLEMPSDYVSAVSLMSFEEAAKYTIGRFSLPDAPEDLMKEWDAMASDAYAESVRLYPGVREFLESLSRRGVHLAIATDLEHSAAEASLRLNGVLNLFDALLTTREAGRDKRFPDVFLMAAAALSLEPSECTVYEDLESAGAVASAAGFAVTDAQSLHQHCLSFLL